MQISKNDPLTYDKAKKFNQAFASGDPDFIIDRVAENVQWNLVGNAQLQGKEAIADMLKPMRGVIPKEYKTKNIIASGNKAVVEGTMKMPKENGEEQRYAFCDIYTFEDSANDTLQALSAYLIVLPE